MKYVSSVMSGLLGSLVGIGLSNTTFVKADIGNTDTVIRGNLVVTGVIKGHSVVLTKDDTRIDLLAQKDYAGLHISRGENKPSVHMYSMKEQGACIALGSSSYLSNPNHGGYDLAFALQDNQEPYIQINHGEKRYGFKEINELVPTYNPKEIE